MYFVKRKNQMWGLPIDRNERERSQQKYRHSSYQSAGKKAEFHGSTAITQVSPNGTGYAVGTVFQAEKDSHVKWCQVKLKIKEIV